MNLTSGLLRIALSLLLIFTSIFYAEAQVIKGRVLSARTKEPVPFAVVAIDNSKKGTTTDIDGNFQISLSDIDQKIIVQVPGYEKKLIEASSLKSDGVNSIFLKEQNIELIEVVVSAGDDPAARLIKKVIENKYKYDVSNLPHYLCETYAKTYFTFSDKNGDEKFYMRDTNKYKSMRKFLDKQFLFLMESVTEKKYSYKNKSQEKVISSRVSGFKSAPFGSFASQLQSFTFYNDNIELLGVKYLSPLTSGTFRRYHFIITDTVVNQHDTDLLVRFWPKKNANFKAMKGTLHINTKQYVLTHVLAEPAVVEKDGTGITVKQAYTRINDSVWFPSEANTEIMFNSVKLNKENEDAVVMKGVSRMYISKVHLDTAVKIRNSSLISYNEKGFDKKNEDYWQTHRKDSLSQKESETYRVIDSIGQKEKLDLKLKWMTALASGKWNLGYFDIDLKHLLNLNDYEGLRAGLGMSTSNKLSPWASIGAYGAYGTKDRAFKYGGQLQVNFEKAANNYLLVEAAKDVEETAGSKFLFDGNGLISTQRLRELLISKMDQVSMARLSLNLAPFNKIKASLYVKAEERTSQFGFYHSDTAGTIASETFKNNEIGIKTRYWPGERYIESLGRLMSTGSKWPLFTFNYAMGLNDPLILQQGELSYHKFDLRIDHQLNFKVKGFLSWQIQAGKVIGNVPYSYQYNNKGSRVDNYSLSIDKTFETMYMNEFISTEYAACFLALNSGKFLKPDSKFNPEIELVHNYGIGRFLNRERITNIELNDISKGYTEAGIRIKSIFRSNFSTFGLAIFYRYGNYAFEKTSQNLTYKMALGFSF